MVQGMNAGSMPLAVWMSLNAVLLLVARFLPEGAGVAVSLLALASSVLMLRVLFAHTRTPNAALAPRKQDT